MSNYSKTTNFAAKDALASGNPLKTIKGTEFNVEFDALQVASATKANIAAPTFTGVPAAPTANAGTNTTQIATTAFANAAATAASAAAMPKSGGAFTGAVTTNSTFDGRDVAADGVLATNAMPKSGGAFSGAVTTNSTFDGVDIATRDGVLTSTTATAAAAMPKSGGAFSGALTTNSTFDGRNVSTDGSKLDGVATNANNFSYPSQSGKTGQFLKTNGSAALWDAVPAGGVEEFVASGTLPNGKPVILKANGQVEVVSGTGGSQSIPLGSESVYNSGASYSNSFAFDPSNAGRFVVVYMDAGNSSHGTAIAGLVSGSSISFGSEVVFNASGSDSPVVAFDPNTAGKFCVAYMDEGNSDAGTAIVGTMSGLSLSFGSEVVFQANSRSMQIAYDPNTANKLVIICRDWAGGAKGNAFVGTVSGTSISFGTKVVFSTQNINFLGLSFDPSTANKFVVTCVDNDNSQYGKALVGTVSGTSTSYGNSEYFNTGTTTFTQVAFDPSNANKCVIVFKDSGNSNYGTARVATVSGTGITFGAEVVFNAADSTYPSVDFDPNRANKCVISYRDSGNSGYATVIEGTVSGTGISFGSEVVVNSGASDETNVLFDPNVSGKFLVTYMDAGNSNYGTAILGQFNTLQTNLTATNFLGTATAAYTNGQTASIMLKGGISDNQSSLTVGSTYYVQTNGTFATSAGTPSVLAGKAVSATSLLLNGLATPDEIPSQSGNTGKFLTTDGSAPSWGTVAPAGLGTVTAASAASIIISGLFSSTYDVYKIFGTQLQGDAENTNLELRFGASDYFPDSGYRFHVHRNNSADTNGSNTYLATNDNSDPSIEVINKVGNEANQAGDSASFEMNIYNPLDAVLHTNVSFTGINQKEGARMMFGVGSNQANISVTRLKFFTSSSTFSGTFKIYGVAK